MTFNDFVQNVLEDLKTDLADEFDRNFENKAFFDQAWPRNKFVNSRGSMMQRTGNLRNSLTAKVEDGKIVFSSSLPYASIHNDGGEITVTAKMKKFFWAKFIESGKKGTEAEQWKALALKKVGSKIKILQRRYIGQHAKVDESVKRAVDDNLAELNQIILNNLKQ